MEVPSINSCVVLNMSLNCFLLVYLCELLASRNCSLIYNSVYLTWTVSLPVLMSRLISRERKRAIQTWKRSLLPSFTQMVLDYKSLFTSVIPVICLLCSIRIVSWLSVGQGKCTTFKFTHSCQFFFCHGYFAWRCLHLYLLDLYPVLHPVNQRLSYGQGDWTFGKDWEEESFYLQLSVFF